MPKRLWFSLKILLVNSPVSTRDWQYAISGCWMPTSSRACIKASGEKVELMNASRFRTEVKGSGLANVVVAPMRTTRIRSVTLAMVGLLFWWCTNVLIEIPKNNKKGRMGGNPGPSVL